MSNDNTWVSVPRMIEMYKTVITRWGLTDDEYLFVLNLSSEEYTRQLAENSDNEPGVETEFSLYLRDRVGMIAQIHTAQMMVAPPGAYDRFIKTPYALAPLNGLSIKTYLTTKNSDEEVMQIVRWLRGMSGPFSDD